MAEGPSKKSKRKKRSKNAGAGQHQNGSSNLIGNGSAVAQVPPPPPPPPPPLDTASSKATHSISRDRIWDTSTQEERERIKEFWLSLSEEERRSLVKVEKEAVLRKMKEQQKHSCSCTVCGRKRTAIEEELEVLYDAYYQELEQYANHQQVDLGGAAPTMPPPRRYGHLPAAHPSNHVPPAMIDHRSSRSRVEELPDDEEDEEDYSDEEDDEDYSDEEIEPDPRGPAADFFNFGNSLTVQGGILTVADDLLKNDGKKFIEMMEQLAERRMQREEEAHYAASGLHPSMSVPGQNAQAGHNHAPPPEDEEYDEEEEEDYDSQEEDEFEEDEDAMTEQQRMEEGRRMFQIFAARMFEQRVLTAYREKVAQERQKKLLEELEEESRLGAQREQKRAKEAQKKKDRKRMQKMAKDEERARKEAEKAAEEAAARAVEEKRAEEQRLKREEQRKKKESEKKAQEEERLRREAERQKKLQEERERQAEQERKHRETKEREKKRKDEARRKEREERENRDRELKEKKERDEKERRAREAAAKAKADQEVRERIRKEEATLAAQQAAAVAQLAPLSTFMTPIQSLKRPAPAPAPVPSVPVPPGLPAQPRLGNVKSPHLQIATPALPKATAPGRARQASQQGSESSSPKTPHVLARKGPSVSPSVTSQQSSPGPIGAPRKASLPHGQSHPAPPSIPIPTSMPPPPGMPLLSPSGYSTMMMMQQPPPPPPTPQPPSQPQPSVASADLATSLPSAFPSFSHRPPVSMESVGYGHHQPPIPAQFRGFAPVSVMSGPQGPAAMRQGPAARGLAMDPAPGVAQYGQQAPIGAQPAAPYSKHRDTMPTHSHSHSRQQSIDTPNLESLEIPPPAGPISKPTPIQRPSSVSRQRPDARRGSLPNEIDDLSDHLGSSALLDSNDEPFSPETGLGRRASAAPMHPAPRRAQSRYPFTPMYPSGVNSAAKADPVTLESPSLSSHSWSAAPSSFGPPSYPRNPAWSPYPGGSGWPNSNAFGIIGGGPGRPSLSRPVNVRLLIVQACKQLTAAKKSGDGFHDLGAILRQIDQIRPPTEAPVQMAEMLDICETEGDAQNGGGFFTIKTEGGTGSGQAQAPGAGTGSGSGVGRTLVRHDAAGNMPAAGRGSIAPGDIGSPIPGSSIPSFGGSSHFASSTSGIASSSGF